MLLLLSLAACGNDDNPEGTGGGGGGGDNPIISKTPPTAEQWADAGIIGTFTADVKGELALSVVDNGEISMKWTGSDEASLDNTIAWLKGQGFSSYGGSNAQKTTEEGGKIISYTAEKTVGGTSTASASGSSGVIPLSFTLTSAENKTMIAESFYITEDFSIMGQTFKGGELYLDIYEAAAVAPQGGLLTEWPVAQIQNVIGSGIPAYTGTASGYQVVDSSASFMKTVQINVFGAGEADATAYNALLAQNGFALNDDEIYAKTLANGDVVQVMAFASQTYHPTTFQIADVVTITVMLEKNSGSYTSWSSLDLSEFSAAGIPAYSGGTSFDLDDAVGEGISADEYQQIIASLEMAEQMGVLDDEGRAQLEEARAKVALAAQVRAKAVTVYGTNADVAGAYETALETAGFVGGLKNVGDFQFQVYIDEADGKAIITITKLPIALAEDIDDNGGSGGGSSIVTEELDWSDLPANVKIAYELNLYGSIQSYTVTKIGNDYLIDMGGGMYSYYKSDGNGSWTEYIKYGADFDWMETSTYTNLSNSDSLGTLEFIFDANISGLTRAADETVAGANCSVYSYTDSYGSETYKLNSDGFVFYVSTSYSAGMTMTSSISLWDTSVTTFDIAVPQ